MSYPSTPNSLPTAISAIRRSPSTACSRRRWAHGSYTSSFSMPCREDPFVSNMKRTVASRSIGRGLARVEPEGGTLVVYAAKDGQIALDGDGQNSPFVTALTKRIAEPNLEIN